MKRTMWLAGVVAVAVLMAYSFSAQAGTYSGYASIAPMIVGPKDGNAGGGMGGGQGGRPEAGRGGGHDELRMIGQATRAPWAKDNADVQKLVDKIIADRKSMLQSETVRLGAFEKFVQANRAGDETAIKSAHEALKTANEKAMADMRQMREDFDALKTKMDELRPAGDRGGQDGDAGGAGAGTHKSHEGHSAPNHK